MREGMEKVSGSMEKRTSQGDHMLATVRARFQQASKMMSDAGYGLKSRVRVLVDPKLPFMGYTFFDGEAYRITVSGMSVESGMLEGLLVHEMSHVYRMENNHPSHNGEVIEEAVGKIVGQTSTDYQERIIHDILNHIQDLYADDIALKVLGKSPIVRSGQMTSFFQNWVRDEAEKTENPLRDRWVNAGILVNNARALGQMRRQGLDDTGDRAALANKRFLSQMPPDMVAEFDYFRKVLVGLREDMTVDEYRRLLTDYLNRFLEIVKQKPENTERSGRRK